MVPIIMEYSAHTLLNAFCFDTFVTNVQVTHCVPSLGMAMASLGMF